MTQLEVIPFVPGIARGILRRGPGPFAPDTILVIHQQELDQLDGTAAGIVVVDGAPLSHPMIRVFGLGLPTVIVSREIAESLVEGSEILIDGSRGRIAQPAGSSPEKAAAPEAPPAGKPVTTADGAEVELRASVSGIQAATLAVAQGAAAIGLVRSEFLLPEGGVQPNAGFYETALRELCDAARPLSVTVRLPDIASDKPVPWYSPAIGTAGPIGLQGARLYHREPVRAVFHAMLDALATLGDDYRPGVLVPYVVHLDEFRHWRNEIEQRLGTSLAIGAMAETPAAVLEIPRWFDVADFVSIGCNDLMQCLFAADRDIPELREYLDPYAPVLFRFLQQAARDAGNNIDRVQLCGMLPQLPGVLPVLLGLGFRAFSVEPVMIPHLAQVVSNTSLHEAEAIAGKICTAKESREVRDQLGVTTGNDGLGR